MISRMGRCLIAGVMGAALLLPAGAAASRLGPPLPQAFWAISRDCNFDPGFATADATTIQMTDPASNFTYTVPSKGSITSLKAQVGKLLACDGTTTIEAPVYPNAIIRVLRPTSTPFKYTVVAQSSTYNNIEANKITEIKGLSLPVEAGDTIGLGNVGYGTRISAQLLSVGIGSDRIYGSFDGAAVGNDLSFFEISPDPLRLLIEAEFTPDPKVFAARLVRPKNRSKVKRLRQFVVRKAEGTQRVQLALRKRAGKGKGRKCLWLNEEDAFSAAMIAAKGDSCKPAKAKWLRVKKFEGSYGYFTLKKKLAPGNYVALVRSYDSYDNVSTLFNAAFKSKAGFKVKPARR